MWWIFIGLASLSTIVYYVCLYFCLNEDTQSVDISELQARVRR